MTAFVVLLVAGCGDGAQERTSADESASGATADEGAVAALPNGPAVGAQAAEGRDVISTGSLTVRVDDAEQAAEDARALAEGAGGFLASADAELDGDQQVTISLRIPSDDFTTVMGEVADLGEVQARTVGTDDVTDQVVDLEGRLENARASADRLRELLGTAENVQNVITIEERLTQRESEIESLSGQLEVVQDQVALATIDITFTESDAPAVSNDLPGPVEALRAGVVAVGNVLLVLLAAAAFALPFLPFVLLGWWLVRRWRRAHPKPGPATWPPTAPLPPPPADESTGEPTAPPAT